MQPFDSKTIAVLAGLFAAVLVAANAAGSKLIAVGPLAASATVFAYAISFILTDVAAEVYGKQLARQMVWIGFGDKWPGALKLLTALKLTNAAQNAMMAQVDVEGRPVEEVVTEWLDANEAVWKPWVDQAMM